MGCAGAPVPWKPPRCARARNPAPATAAEDKAAVTATAAAAAAAAAAVEPRSGCGPGAEHAPARGPFEPFIHEDGGGHSTGLAGQSLAPVVDRRGGRSVCSCEPNARSAESAGQARPGAAAGAAAASHCAPNPGCSLGGSAGHNGLRMEPASAETPAGGSANRPEPLPPEVTAAARRAAEGRGLPGLQ